MAKRAKLYQAEGIVLSRRDYGEADRIIICLTPEGRLDLLAKGVRKTQSRKSGHLELFTRTKMLISRVTGSWDIISQAEAVQQRPLLQEDYRRGTKARYVAELVFRFFEREADDQLYALLDGTMAQLETEDDPDLVVRWYEQRLLALAGFQPQWRRCVGERQGSQCNVDLRPQPSDRRPYGLDPERGGALCSGCHVALRQDPVVRSLTPSALSWLQALQSRDYEELLDFELSASTSRELAAAMQAYITHHLEYRPSSLKLAEA